ncbi:MAG: PKD domain-containing protein [Planctomycetota bacterium]|nr:PKD domain-containing protein [Planctomycetota bacterium]
MTFSWDLDVPAGLKARLSPAQTIEFVDSQGVPRLRINAPEGKDAAGTKLEIRNSKSEGKGETEELTRGGPRLTLTLDGSRVTLAADVRGLKLPVVIDPTWSSTGSLAKERSYHTATLLGNGKVLVAGSADATLLGSCELYDPSTGTWAATGALSAWRGNFAATLLANGKVLLAGGADADGIDVAPCELYDPSTGTWTPTGALGTTRGGGTATLLANGLVLVAGGYHSSAPVASCELYDPSTGAWTPTGALNTARYDHTATLLGNGKALVAGGYGPIASCELYDPSTGTWAATGALNTARGGQTATLLGNGKVLVVGGWNSGRLSVCEAYDPASGTWSATGSLATVRYGCTTNLLGSGLVLAAGGDDGRTSFSSCELYDLATESWRATVAMAQARSWHTATRLGDGMILVAGGVVVGNGTSYEIATCELFDPTVPEAGATATPMIVATGSPVAFSGQGSDLDGNPMSFSWDFGDGGTANEQNPQHIYVTAGTYIATVTVTGPTGKSAQASVTITASRAPVPRLVTSDVVAFAGNPFQFDASYSTDPENDIASYSWDFGDGSPLGSGQVIAKIYNSPGEYTVTLTVTDSAGVSSTLTRIIQVLPADEIGLFNGFVIYQVRWDRNKTNKDSLSLSASVNVGDTVVGPDMPVALEIAGVRFTGSLDKKLRDYSDKNTKWQVKAGLRKQPFGAVLVKVKIKSASLGAGFNQAGAVVGADPTDTVSVDIPAKIEIGDRSFEVVVPSEFDFNNDGTKAKGNGEF